MQTYTLVTEGEVIQTIEVASGRNSRVTNISNLRSLINLTNKDVNLKDCVNYYNYIDCFGSVSFISHNGPESFHSTITLDKPRESFGITAFGMADMFRVHSQEDLNKWVIENAQMFPEFTVRKVQF